MVDERVLGWEPGEGCHGTPFQAAMRVVELESHAGLRWPAPPLGSGHILTAAAATGPGAPGTEKGPPATSEGILHAHTGVAPPRPPSLTSPSQSADGAGPHFPQDLPAATGHGAHSGQVEDGAQPGAPFELLEFL